MTSPVWKCSGVLERVIESDVELCRGMVLREANVRQLTGRQEVSSVLAVQEREEGSAVVYRESVDKASRYKNLRCLLTAIIPSQEP
jgi:hypothetical protein